VHQVDEQVANNQIPFDLTMESSFYNKNKPRPEQNPSQSNIRLATPIVSQGKLISGRAEQRISISHCAVYDVDLLSIGTTISTFD